MNSCLLFNMADFQQGLVTTVLGFGVVFFVLIVIWLMLVIFSVILKAFEKNKAVPEKNSVAINTAPVKKEESVNEKNLIDDRELVAVITAAIAASMGQNVGPDKLVIKRLRRVRKSGWQTEAIHEQHNNAL